MLKLSFYGNIKFEFSSNLKTEKIIKNTIQSSKIIQ